MTDRHQTSHDDGTCIRDFPGVKTLYLRLVNYDVITCMSVTYVRETKSTARIVTKLNMMTDYVFESVRLPVSELWRHHLFVCLSVTDVRKKYKYSWKYVCLFVIYARETYCTDRHQTSHGDGTCIRECSDVKTVYLLLPVSELWHHHLSVCNICTRNEKYCTDRHQTSHADRTCIQECYDVKQIVLPVSELWHHHLSVCL